MEKLPSHLAYESPSETQVVPAVCHVSVVFIGFLETDLLKLILVIRVMPGSFGGGTYKRVKLWAYFRSNHELAGAALGLQGGRSGTLPWSCH